MDAPFYAGRYREDGLTEPHRGWIVGQFKPDAPRRTDQVEIKYWEFPAGPSDHPAKTSTIIECTLVLKGVVRAVIDGHELILSAGDYVVIAPGTPNNTVVEILEDAAGLTVKAPSDPSAKRVL
jgi:quercetin dioxygenase-like cupin family protein